MRATLFLFAVLAGLTTASILPAQAAMPIERARLEVLGFSPDGRFFAYRQSGVESTSGEAYADLFITEVKKNQSIKGTPIRVKAPSGPEALTKARASLDTQSARLMRQLGLNKAIAGVAFVPKKQTELNYTLPWGEHVGMRLSPRAGLAAPGCNMKPKIPKSGLMGFTMTAQRPVDVTVVHNDTIVPRLRGCAMAYRFASGYQKSLGDQVALASMVAYAEPIPTGNTRVRYLVVTSVLDAPGGT